MQITENTYKIVIAFVVSFILFTLLYNATTRSNYIEETKIIHHLPPHLNKATLDTLHINNTSNDPEVRKRLPQCIILGLRKAGTNALKNFMNIHPDIVAAYGEMHFFGKKSEFKKGMDICFIYLRYTAIMISSQIQPTKVGY